MKILIFFVLALPAVAAPVRFSLTLDQAEKSALVHSLSIREASARSAAASDQAESQFSALVPRLTLDGSYRYQTELAQIAVVPGTQPRAFNDHRVTSLGPTLNWTLWDQGALYKSWRVQSATAQSVQAQERLIQSQVLMGIRLAYAQVQLAREQVWLLADSVIVADAQYADIEKRLQAGSSSRIDLLSSHQQALQRRKDFLNAQAGLATSLRELFQLTGLGEGLDARRPIDARIAQLPSGFAEPTISLELDRLETPSAALSSQANPNTQHPSIVMAERQIQAETLAQEAVRAGLWPKIQLQARVSYDYPNQSALEYVTQKYVSLSASVPLFEMRKTSREARQHEHLALAAQHRRDLALEQLTRDWDKAQASISALKDQETLDAKSVSEAEELARLVYSAYKAGRSNFLDVQTYNLNALQAKVAAARTRAQILIQLAMLAQLAVQG